MPYAGLPIYFQNPVACIYEHPDGYAVFAYAPGRRALPELQAALHHLSRLLEHRDWHGVLGDQRRMAPFTAEESAWISEEWFALATRRSGLCAAVLVADDVFARLAANQVRHQATAVTYRTFQDAAEAAAWLRQHA